MTKNDAKEDKTFVVINASEGSLFTRILTLHTSVLKSPKIIDSHCKKSLLDEHKESKIVYKFCCTGML
jgi:hypothetical protein